MYKMIRSKNDAREIVEAVENGTYWSSYIGLLKEGDVDNNNCYKDKEGRTIFYCDYLSHEWKETHRKQNEGWEHDEPVLRSALIKYLYIHRKMANEYTRRYCTSYQWDMIDKARLQQTRGEY